MKLFVILTAIFGIFHLISASSIEKLEDNFDQLDRFTKDCVNKNFTCSLSRNVFRKLLGLIKICNEEKEMLHSKLIKCVNENRQEELVFRSSMLLMLILCNAL